MAAHAADAGAPHSVSGEVVDDDIEAVLLVRNELEQDIDKLLAIEQMALDGAESVAEERSLAPLLNVARNCRSRAAELRQSLAEIDVTMLNERRLAAAERARIQGGGGAVSHDGGDASLTAAHQRPC